MHKNNFNLIRLLAALQVLLIHAANHFEIDGVIFEALRIAPGVPTFFFTSGYLIFYSFDRMHTRSIANFYRNRILRIYPALWVCIAVSILTVWQSGYLDNTSADPTSFVAWIGAQASIFQFYNPDFMRGYGVGVLNGALWTITVEVQFYVLVPAVYWLVKKQKRLAIIVVATSIAVNFAVREYLAWDTIYTKLLYVSFAPWIYMFLAGAFVASSTRVQNWVNRIDLKYLIVSYIISMFFIGAYETNASNAINPLSFALLAASILKFSSLPLLIPQSVNNFIQKTDFSYAIYLYHMPIINYLMFVNWFSPLENLAALVLSTSVAAAISWYLVERPALRLKRK